MSTRDQILNRIRRQTRPGPASAPPPVIPAQGRPADAVAQFQAKLAAVHGTSSRLANLTDLPAALAAELRARNLPAAIRLGADPALAELDFGTITLSHGPGRIEEPVTLTMAVAGIAETGTLVMQSGPDNPITLNFLGETHFAVLRVDDLEDNLNAALARVRASGADARTLTLITGPSRTGDIEQKLELGAHGPVALHVFIVGA